MHLLLGNRNANSNEEKRKSNTGTHRFNVENPSAKKGKNHGRQPANYLLFWRCYKRRGIYNWMIYPVQRLTRYYLGGRRDLRQKLAFSFILEFGSYFNKAQAPPPTVVPDEADTGQAGPPAR